MMFRVLLLAMVLASGPLQTEGQETSGPPIIQRMGTSRSKQSTLSKELQRVLRRDDVEEGAALIEELLAMGIGPVTVFHQVQSAATPRGQALLPAVLKDMGGADTQSLHRELLLLLAVHGDDDAATDSLMGTLDTVPTVSQPTLSVVAATARAAGKVHVALWAYEQLRRHHEPMRRQITVPLAECLVYDNRIKEAAALLDSFLEVPGVPESYRDQARLLQARLVYKHGEETEKALGLLGDVKDRRARSEAQLLGTIIQFLESGNDSLTNRLETLARMRPDIKEANDAFDLARLSPFLPPDNREQNAVLHALRLDFRGQWESAGGAYLSIRATMEPPLSSYLGIRAARCLERAGEFEKALDVWDRVIDTDDDVAIALLGKGDCQANMGLPDSAKVTYLTILREYPDSPHAARARSRLLD